MKSDKDIILDFLETIKKEIIERHIASGQRASGQTMADMMAEATDVRGVLSGPSYVFALEDGRGPSKNSGSSGSKSLKDRIREWIDAKGINPQGISKNSLAFLIARRIHEQGTILFRRGGKSGVISTSITEERITAFIGTFAQKYSNQFKTELVTEFNK